MKSVLFLVILFTIFSCTNSQRDKQSIIKPDTQHTIPQPQVTLIANLPDSSQPKKTDLNKVSKPQKVVLRNPPKALPAGIIAHMQTYTTDQGLTMDAIRCAIMDHFGNLWFCTLGGGVSRYDGKSFTNFTTAQGLANNLIFGIAEDHSGNLWFATMGGGASRYDGKSFTNFTTAQGLANNSVRSMAIDRVGNLWFGTSGGGVSRLDKKQSSPCINNICRHDFRVPQELEAHNKEIARSFTSLTTAQGLASNVIWSIAEDHSGNIWFGTDGKGVSRYEANRTSPCNNNTCKHDLRNSQDLEEHNREVAKSFTTFSTVQGLIANFVSTILEDQSGYIWFGTDGYGVSRYDPKLAGSCNSNACTHDLENRQDLEAHNKQIAKSFVSFTTSQGLAGNTIIGITEDRSGKTWFATNGGGVSCYDGERASPCDNNTCKHNLRVHRDFEEHNKEVAKSFTNFTTAEDLASNAVGSITEDQSGNLWFGTGEGGVTRYDGKSFINFIRGRGPINHEVMSISEDQSGNHWFGTEGGGVFTYNGKLFTGFTTVQGLFSNSIRSITEDRSGNLWFGTGGGGVSRYDGRSFTNFTTEQGLASNSVWGIIEDKSGSLWFATGGGVSRYDGKSFVNFTTLQGLGNNSVWSVIEDKSENLWFGTYGGGVSRYDGKSFVNFTTLQGLANNFIFTMMEDESGNLWFGTQGGLSVLSSDQLRSLTQKNNKIGSISAYSKSIFKNFTIADGLPDNNVMQVVEDKNGKIYVGTNLGICEMIGKGIERTVGRIFNSSTGFPVKDVSPGQKAMFLDSKGTIWIGTGSNKTALVRFDPSALHQSSEPPCVIIQSIKVNEENICWYDLQSKGIRQNKNDSLTAVLQESITYGKTQSQTDINLLLKKFGTIEFDSITRFYPLPQHLVLPHEYNEVSFDFTAIEPARPYLVNYQCILEGYDKDWSPVTTRTHAVFGNLSGGFYTFKLKAQGTNGIWSKPVSYSFRVLPPWYETWWFYLLVLFAIISITYSLYRIRINQILKLQLVRNRIASDLHDDIGSTLNSISVYSQVAIKEFGKPSRSLEMIGESSRKIIDSISDIVWTINPENDTFENIILRMRSLSYNLLHAKEIEFTFYADESLNHIKLPMESRKNFYMIFKEALNNLVKYSQAKNASINLSRESNAVKLFIQDDGSGFDVSKSSEGNGLNNMRRRAKEMKAEIKIESQKDNGTKIELRLKI